MPTKEKHIEKRQLKDGYSYRVTMKINGKNTVIGTFNRADYLSDRQCLEAARQCRDQALIDRRQNRTIISDLTVQEAYESAMDVLVDNVNTRKRYDIMHNQLFSGRSEKLLDMYLKDITAADIQTSINDFASDHSDDAVPRTLGLWRLIYKAAMFKGIYLADLTTIIKIPKGKKAIRERKKFCTDEELEIFLNALLQYKSPPRSDGISYVRDIYLAFRIMQYMGLRPQEVFALCQEDIDLKNMVLHVRRSVGSDDKSARLLVATKTSKAMRTIPIPSYAKEECEELLTHNTTPLLVDEDGLPYDTAKVCMTVRLVCQKDGVPKVTMYQMRHNFSTDLSKESVKGTQTLMGHEDATMTLGYANQADLEELRKLMEDRKK